MNSHADNTKQQPWSQNVETTRWTTSTVSFNANEFMYASWWNKCRPWRLFQGIMGNRLVIASPRVYASAGEVSSCFEF
ncbi:hypothetical protein K0M31_010966 [Melipona bicolor]|uniref:Uncharacterized protein n=1 Tax=Melipona bicolor TaxID=60889 RepID=A0AA40KHQ0_9HYME|nr:hypothetical protein K0M31_010966 [Melipona bicolor]